MTCLFRDFDVGIFCDTSISRFCKHFIFWITLDSRVWIQQFTFHRQCYLTCLWIKYNHFIKGTITSKLRKTKLFSQCPPAVHACTWIIVLQSIDRNIHLHWKFIRKVKNVICKRFSGKKLVLSWLWGVRHLIFAISFVLRNSRN